MLWDNINTEFWKSGVIYNINSIWKANFEKNSGKYNGIEFDVALDLTEGDLWFYSFQTKRSKY